MMIHKKHEKNNLIKVKFVKPVYKTARKKSVALFKISFKSENLEMSDSSVAGSGTENGCCLI